MKDLRPKIGDLVTVDQSYYPTLPPNSVGEVISIHKFGSIEIKIDGWQVGHSGTSSNHTDADRWYVKPNHILFVVGTTKSTTPVKSTLDSVADKYIDEFSATYPYNVTDRKSIKQAFVAGSRYVSKISAEERREAKLNVERLRFLCQETHGGQKEFEEFLIDIDRTINDGQPPAATLDNLNKTESWIKKFVELG